MSRQRNQSANFVTVILLTDRQTDGRDRITSSHVGGSKLFTDADAFSARRRQDERND